MNKIEVYQSTDKFDFRKVEKLLKSKNINYEILYGYKLYEELNAGETSGGAIIKVSRNNLMAANYLLLKNGFIEEGDIENYESKIITKITSIFDNIPILKHLTKASKFVILMTIIFGLPIILLFIKSVNWKGVELAGNVWCVQNIESNGIKKMPYTTNQIIVVTCRESVRFQKNGIVFLPGFYSKTIKANWKYLNNQESIEIYESERFDEIYDGVYSVKWHPIDRIYTLKSNTILIRIKLGF